MGGPAVRRYVADGRVRGYPVRTEHVRIPMDDGIDLAATLYLPDAPGDGPFPALLESIPYRKDDWTLSRDWPLHGAFAAAGYVSCRLDVRGTGSSRGIADDEYTEREILDNLAVIDWLANRPGAGGPVGMFGISWGGFSALQAAMRRPPALRAIIPACFSHDRYHVDVHWWGGTRLIGESVYWPVEMVGENALPPDPERFGEGWREEWLRRLDATPQWPMSSLRHQRRDAHWRHGSAIEDWGSIEAATLALGGLNDSYRDSVPAVVANVRAPVRGVLGPWGHAWPHAGGPGPTIDGVGLMTRWWDRWLRGERNGVDEGPALTVFAVEPEGAQPFPTAVAPAEVPGRWWAIGRWPSVLRIAPPPPLHLGGVGSAGLGTLDERPPSVGAPSDTWTGGPAVALTAPFTCTGSEPQGGPLDQRPDDAGSLVYTSEPLAEPVLVVGIPVVDLWVAADRPVAQVAVRLEAVAPDGSVGAARPRPPQPDPAPLVRGSGADRARRGHGRLGPAHRDRRPRPRRSAPAHRDRRRRLPHRLAAARPGRPDPLPRRAAPVAPPPPDARRLGARHRGARHRGLGPGPCRAPARDRRHVARGTRRACRARPPSSRSSGAAIASPSATGSSSPPTSASGSPLTTTGRTRPRTARRSTASPGPAARP